MARARAAVIGSGIAGIAMAHALRRAGLEVEIFEQTHESRSTGYQLNVLGNGMYALARIGLRDALLESGFGAPLRAAPIVDGQSGRVVRTLPPPGLGTPYAPRSYYRGDLHRALLGGLTGDPPRCDCEVVGVSQDGATASLRLADGQERSFDLVVAADGARSKIRRQLFGDGAEYHARFSALLFAADVDIAGSSAAERLFREQLERGEFVQIGMPGHGVVLSAAGGGRFGFFVARLLPEFSPHVPDASAARDLARQLTRGIRDPRVAHGVERARWDEGNPLVWRVGDIEPLPRFHEGRVALAGDAAHAMIPVVGQGANQSFEDAMVLSEALADELQGSPPVAAGIDRALARYSAERAPHVARVQREARRRLAGMSARSQLGYRFGNLVLRVIPERLFARFDAHLMKYASAGADSA